jgi:hypothetical protein
VRTVRFLHCNLLTSATRREQIGRLRIDRPSLPPTTILRALRLLLRTYATMPKAKVKATPSTFSSRVTLYEPDSKPVLPMKRTRSSAPLPAEASSGEEEEDVKVKVEEKPKKPKKPTPFKNSLAKPHPAPKNWERVLEIISLQRET